MSNEQHHEEISTRGFFSKYKFWLVGLIALAVFLLSWTQATKTDTRVVSFGWDTSQVRELKPFGIDSSNLRIDHGYAIDATSYYPLYYQPDNRCTVLGELDTTKRLIEPEETASSQLIANKSGQPAADIRNGNIRYNGANVPVKLASYEKDSQYITVLGRYFAQEKLKLTVTITCDNETKLDNATKNTLDSFRIVERKSRF